MFSPRLTRTVLGIAAFFLAGQASAGVNLKPLYMPLGVTAEGPQGFIDMCTRTPELCPITAVTLNFGMPAVPAVVPMPTLDLKQLRHINRYVNRHVRMETDQDALGVGELWRPSGVGKGSVGDCEDIALQKQIELRAAGYPPSSTMLAVAYGRGIGLHTVLVVRTQSGDYVLDNMTSRVKPWAKVRYSWLRIQSPDDPSSWRQVA